MSGSDERKLYERLKREAEASGYLLNPDTDFVLDLMEGLIANDRRYGYMSCPCRLAAGVRERDRDMICPCDYRDPDLADFGACYCALYVSEEVAAGKRELASVPERRPRGGSAKHEEEHREELVGFTRSGIPVWRCVVCGYLCARPEPPLKCPICKVDRDRFERFA
ncbi:MAG: ferredoxin-thioredoxin reductase catalytic domain-containing protein [Deltaproteobacteria bacterium]|nr:ferredoxin-thioredoxin reductase catalytic domain-containing protein [Deltaproteobacteria bacterium]